MRAWLAIMSNSTRSICTPGALTGLARNLLPGRGVGGGL